MHEIIQLLGIPAYEKLRGDLSSFDRLQDDASRLQMVFTKIVEEGISLPTCAPKSNQYVMDYNKMIAWFENQNYKESLIEINNVFRSLPRSNENEHLIVCYFELLQVRINLLDYNKKYKQAEKDIRVLQKYLPTRLTPESRARYQSILITAARIPNRPPLEELTWKSENLRLPALSDKTQVKYKPQKGKHLVALQDILVGEIIGVEAPFACFIGSPDHCTHCGIFADDVIYVCPECPAVFCSMECLEKAATYHRYECGLIDGISLPIRCILRMITQRTLSQLMKDQRIAQGTRNVDNEYFHIYRLDHRHIPGGLFDDTLLAALLLRFLLQKKYLPTSTTTALTKKQIFVAKLIMIYSGIVKFNSYPIRTHNEDIIGIGLYRTLSSINHSCEPTLWGYNVRNKLVVRCIKPIKAGEEVTISYIFNKTYSKVCKELRVAFLENYNFICQCLPCVENWPTCQGFRSDSCWVLCGCGGKVYVPTAKSRAPKKCSLCKRMINVEIPLEKLLGLNVAAMHASKLVQDEGYESQKLMVDQLNMIFNYIAMPTPTVFLLQDLLGLTWMQNTQRDVSY